MDATPRLLVAAHGTESHQGTAMVQALAELVRAARPGLSVAVGFVGVRPPSLTDALAATLDDGRPTVVVPALLSTGTHVKRDIPSAAAAFSSARVARHLGPHRLLSEVLAERLEQARDGRPPRPVALVSTGSSDPDARIELEAAASDLSVVLGEKVVGLEFLDLGRPLTGYDVVAYLLAEGFFTDAIKFKSDGVCTAAIGAHPAVAELILQRFDDALNQSADSGG